MLCFRYENFIKSLKLSCTLHDLFMLCSWKVYDIFTKISEIPRTYHNLFTWNLWPFVEKEWDSIGQSRKHIIFVGSKCDNAWTHPYILRKTSERMRTVMQQYIKHNMNFMQKNKRSHRNITQQLYNFINKYMSFRWNLMVTDVKMTTV